MKIDFFKDRVFVLTPRGDVIDLPEGSTPIDFAYHIHSEIGDHMSGAKVNNRIAPFEHQLVSGDIVEIITQKNKKPSAEWLNAAKTSLAKGHIRSALKKNKYFWNLLPKKEKTGSKVEITVIAKDRIGLLKDISTVFSSVHISIQNIIIKQDSDYPKIHRYLHAERQRTTPKNKIEVKTGRKRS